MSPDLALHALASAVVAGSWISATTLLAERRGALAGGLLANTPSNVLVSLAFVGAAQGALFAGRAALAVPVGMLIDTLFLAVVVLLLPRGLAPALAAGFATWALLALLAQGARYEDPLGGAALYALVALGSYALLDRWARVRTVAPTVRAYSARQLAARAAFAGAVVGTTVLASGFAGSYATGILATFPAVLTSTLVILARQQGPDFARATGKVMVLASSNIVVYGFAVALTYPSLGIVAGTALSLAAAFAWVALLRPALARLG